MSASGMLWVRTTAVTAVLAARSASSEASRAPWPWLKMETVIMGLRGTWAGTRSQTCSAMQPVRVGGRQRGMPGRRKHPERSQQVDGHRAPHLLHSHAATDEPQQSRQPAPPHVAVEPPYEFLRVLGQPTPEMGRQGLALADSRLHPAYEFPPAKDVLDDVAAPRAHRVAPVLPVQHRCIGQGDDFTPGRRDEGQPPVVHD